MHTPGPAKNNEKGIGIRIRARIFRAALIVDTREDAAKFVAAVLLEADVLGTSNSDLSRGMSTICRPDILASLDWQELNLLYGISDISADKRTARTIR